MEEKPYQRKGAKSNAHVGKAFERRAKAYFAKQGISLKENVSINIGINGSKAHEFDLGDVDSKILVECKSHKWTEGRNVPSAKITTWDQAMYMFYVAPKLYRKILFVLRDWSASKGETLAGYYARTHYHLVPKDVEIWEFEEDKNTASKVN